jgi:hypothetical protein
MGSQPSSYARLTTRYTLESVRCRPRLSTRLTLLDCLSAACLTKALYLSLVYLLGRLHIRGECLNSCLSMVRH